MILNYVEMENQYITNLNKKGLDIHILKPDDFEDYKKAVEKLIDTYMEQNAYLYQSRVKNSIMILLRQYVNSEREK